MELPLVRKLKASGHLDESVDTKHAVAFSIEGDSDPRDEAELQEKLLALARVTLEGMADRRLTFYEIWSIGWAFVSALKASRKVMKAEEAEKAGASGKKGRKKKE